MATPHERETQFGRGARQPDAGGQHPSPQLLSQERARFALARVQAAQNQPHDREFRALLEGFPALIRQVGIGQAVALQMSNQQRSAAAGHLLKALNEWLTTGDRPLAGLPGRSLMDRLTGAPRHVYLAAQEEALIISGWLKLFAQALLKEAR